MYIDKGISRIAFIGKRYTVKIPRIAPRQFGQFAREAWIVTTGFFINLNTLPIKESIKDALKMGQYLKSTAGIIANIWEWKYSKILDLSVVPTRFSFLGLFNVMDTAKPWRMSQEYFMENYPFDCVRGHTMENTRNFGWHGGSVKLLDYGDINVIEYLLENKAVFRRQLDAFVETPIDPLASHLAPYSY